MDHKAFKMGGTENLDAQFVYYSLKMCMLVPGGLLLSKIQSPSGFDLHCSIWAPGLCVGILGWRK